MQKNQAGQLSIKSLAGTIPIDAKWLFALASGILILYLFYPDIKQTLVCSTNAHAETQLFPGKNATAFAGIADIKSTENVNDVVTDALAFYNMLSSSQQSILQLTYTNTLARKWSNLPCGTSCRNGLQLGTNLNSEQYAAAMLIVKDALNSGANNGYDEFHQMNLAEAYLHSHGGGAGYDSTLRWMCFLNAPTITGAWMLQFGGHHYAANIAFNNGHVIGATPFFMGLEPKTFNYNSVDYDPLGDEKNALTAMLASLSSSQLSAAYISSSFMDCVMIPGESNGGATSFPAVGIGQPVSSLTGDQQNLVLASIQNYTSDMDPATAENVMAGYTNEITQTYISYHGSGSSGNASSFLSAQGDYARISGPNVWIEFSCQGGIVIQGQIHYHTIWRDRSHDYGIDLTGAAIDVAGTTGISEEKHGKMINVYPNPSVSEINMILPERVINAKISIIASDGKTVYGDGNFSGEKLNINIQSFANGNYFLNVKDNSHFYSSKFIKE